MNKETRLNLGYIVAALLGVLLLHSVIASRLSITAIPYSEFQRYLREGQVAEVEVSDRYVEGTLKGKLPDGSDRFTTTRVDPDLAHELQEHGVKYDGAVESNLIATLASWLMPILLFFGIWWFAMRRFAAGQGMGGGLMQIGKSKAKIYVEADTKVTFADVAGVDEAKDELKEIVAFLKDPSGYGRLGARMPKGVLLVGPPGTGKTLLAKAVAGESSVPFFLISGSEFVEMFVGVGAARVRDLFEQARQKAPAIIFIDELDALGRARGIGPFSGGHDEKEQTLNQLLVELDGFDSSSGVVLLAATNRPEILDPALLRAGRFDRQVLVDRPDRTGRVQILNVHLRKARLATDVDPEQIAALTPGFTGADLANLVNEAALVATRRNAEAVTMADFNEGIERILAGLEKRNRLLNPKEREVVAYHEMGHALVALALPGSDAIHKVSIIPRGIGALGYTIQRPTEDRFLMSREELEDKMAVLLGGRAAEWIVFGNLTTGAADDLRRVTDLARSMVTRYGMSTALGPIAYEQERGSMLGLPPTSLGYPERRDYAEVTATAIDEEVRGIVQAAFDRTVALLQERRQILDVAAQRLLESESLNEHELLELVGTVFPATHNLNQEANDEMTPADQQS